MSTDFFNSKLFAAFSFITNLLVINVCWIALCLPIFTAGASTAALYYCAEKMRTGELVYPIKTFWQAFRSNFKQGTILLVLSALLLALTAVDVFVILRINTITESWVTVLLLLPFALTVPCLCYIFPLQGNYDNTVIRTITVAWRLFVIHPVTTVLVLAINLLPLAAGLIWPEQMMIFVMLWTAVGGSLPAYFSMKLLSKVFLQYD